MERSCYSCDIIPPSPNHPTRRKLFPSFFFKWRESVCSTQTLANQAPTPPRWMSKQIESCKDHNDTDESEGDDIFVPDSPDSPSSRRPKSPSEFQQQEPSQSVGEDQGMPTHNYTNDYNYNLTAVTDYY